MGNQDRPEPSPLRFVTPSSLWPPRLTSEVSAWNGHVPFAGWIVEATQPRVFVELGTHIGVSYFAFCESVARLGLGTECFAVDTWEGDEHAGFYGEDVYNSVREINSRYYESFSHLLRSTFDDAVEQFADSSIDLLHLDGLHTYEAVRHDFEMWLPKLSNRAVMLFHDTNERKKDFGVYRVLAELKDEYPTFEFMHEHGLGVVCIGEDAPEAVVALIGLEGPQATELRSIYESLGGRLSGEVQQSVLSEAIVRRDAELGVLSAAVADRDVKLGQLSAAVSERDVKLGQLSAAVSERDVKLGQLSAAVSERDVDLGELSDTVADLRRGLSSTRRSLSRLRNRRSVRLALFVSRLFRPLFRFVRRIRSPRGHSATSSPYKGSRGKTPAETTGLPATGNLALLRVPELLPTLDRDSERVTVIVPVYNAPDDLSACLRALIRNTTGVAELLLIDDASTDERVAPILDDIVDVEGIRVLQNEQNLGFVKTVNRGFAETTGDVVILNSDTEVTPGWLDRLRVAARIVPEAGTITSLADNAGAFSAPQIATKNSVPLSLTRDEIGRAVAQSSKRFYPRSPTGNGFCMYIRRACLDDVGVFDAEAFPRGYGEENDFCMRALKRGWLNIVDDSTYVFHGRSASFGEEKHALMAAGREVLDRRYPEYGALVREFVSSAELVAARDQVADVFDQARSARTGPRPRVLFALHGGTGGTPATARDLMAGLEDTYESLLLISHGKTVTLSRWAFNDVQEIDRWSLRQPILVTDVTSPEYRAIVQDVLIDHAIDVVHIRHLIGHSFDLPAVAKSLGLPVVLSFHDFYYICPTVHLMDDRGRFCGGVCSEGQGECIAPTPWLAEVPHLKHAWVYDWRSRASEMFENIDAFVTTAESMKEFYLGAFPELGERVFRVIEHGRELVLAEHPVGKSPEPGGRVRILLPGHLGPHKGSQFVKALIELDTDRRLEFHVLGRPGKYLMRHVVDHGVYEREEFEDRARAIAPSFVGIFSTTAESHSHVLSEAWAAGIPVLASNLGALEERINRHGGGWLLDVDDPAAALKRILEIASDPEQYRVQLARGVDAASRLRSVDEMAFQYADVYGMLRQSRRALASHTEASIDGERVLRVGAFLPTDRRGGIHPPGHIRVLRRLSSPELADRVVWSTGNADRFVAGGEHGIALDVVIVLRNAVPPALADAFVEKCRQDGIGIVYDIDDDLLSTDPEWAELDSFRPFQQSIKTIAAAAAAVTVSTPRLAERMNGHNADVHVLPNALDRRLWLRSLNSDLELPDDWTQDASTLRLLFFGGMTHGRDLEVLRPVIERLRSHAGVAVELSVVGGVPATDRQSWYRSIEIPAGYYPRFAPWLQSIRSGFDIGVAPLTDSMLNENKSDLRFLEYAALGLPGVYSRGTAFATVDNESTGLVVDNDVDSWSEAILRLWNDKELRANIQHNALEYVVGERLISDQSDEYLAILLSAASS